MERSGKLFGCSVSVCVSVCLSLWSQLSVSRSISPSLSMTLYVEPLLNDNSYLSVSLSFCFSPKQFNIPIMVY